MKFFISKCSALSSLACCCNLWKSQWSTKRHHFSQQWCVQDAAGTRFDWFPCSQYHHSLFLEQHLALFTLSSLLPPPQSSSLLDSYVSSSLRRFSKNDITDIVCKRYFKKERMRKNSVFFRRKEQGDTCSMQAYPGGLKLIIFPFKRVMLLGWGK